MNEYDVIFSGFLKRYFDRTVAERW